MIQLTNKSRNSTIKKVERQEEKRGGRNNTKGSTQDNANRFHYRRNNYQLKTKGFRVSFGFEARHHQEEETKEEAVRFYKDLLETPTKNQYLGIIHELKKIVHRRIKPKQAEIMNREPIEEEIKETMFSHHSNKAHGPMVTKPISLRKHGTPPFLF